MAALEKLPPRQRACVVLRYFEDLDVAATAAALGLQPGHGQEPDVTRPRLPALHVRRARRPASSRFSTRGPRHGERTPHACCTRAARMRRTPTSTPPRSCARAARGSVAAAPPMVGAAAASPPPPWWLRHPGPRREDPKADPAPPDRPVGQVLTPVRRDLGRPDADLHRASFRPRDFANAQLVDGVTDDGQAVVRDATRTACSNLSCVDLASGDEEPLPDFAGGQGQPPARGHRRTSGLLRLTPRRPPTEPASAP